MQTVIYLELEIVQVNMSVLHVHCIEIVFIKANNGDIMYIMYIL